MTSNMRNSAIPTASKNGSSIVANRFVWVTGVGSLAVSGALITYAIHNGSGHTGFEPWLLSIVFVTSLISGLASLFFGGPRLAGSIACAAGILGSALLFSLDHFNILLQYERWLQRGMP